MKALLVLIVFVLSTMITLLIDRSLGITLLNYTDWQVICHKAAYMAAGAAIVWVINR